MSKKNSTVTVIAQAKYRPDQSDPPNKKFIWSYDVVIENQSSEAIQILSRCWRITDMTGHIEEVHGTGVIGLQPLIRVGKKFSYSSLCQLMTPQGTMEGYYEIQTIEEVKSKVEIPKFILSAPAMFLQGFKSKLH